MFNPKDTLFWGAMFLATSRLAWSYPPAVGAGMYVALAVAIFVFA